MFNVYDGTKGLQKEAAVVHIKAFLDRGSEGNHSFDIANCRIRCIYLNWINKFVDAFTLSPYETFCTSSLSRFLLPLISDARLCLRKL